MQPCADLNHAAHACAFAKNPNQALTNRQSESACLSVLRYLCIYNEHVSTYKCHTLHT